MAYTKIGLGIAKGHFEIGSGRKFDKEVVIHE